MRRGALLVGAGALGAVAAAIGQLVPPFHLLTHEFTQALAALGGLGCALAGRRLSRRYPPGEALALALGAGMSGAAGAWAAQLAFNAAGHGCRTPDGSAFFWVTIPPLLALGAALGVAGRRLRRRAMIALASALIAASLAHDGLQLLAGVQVVDPLVGMPRFADQRAGMAVPALHLYQRLWLLALATAAALLGLGLRRAAAAAALALAAVTALAGSFAGVGWGDGALRARLDGELRTDHFVFRYASGGQAALYLGPIARRAAWEQRRLGADWGLRSERPVEVRLFESYPDLEAATGMSSAHAGLYWINLPWWAALGDTLPHELVHALHAELSWRPDLAVLRGHTEGLAEAWEGHLAALPEAHAAQAGALRAGLLPDAAQFMGLGGFTAINERAAYSAAGSFVGWLIRARGWERFAALQRRLDYAAVYGEDLGALEAEWRMFLLTVPVDLQAQGRARERFDPERAPPYLAARCPKLGPRVPDPADEAKRRFDAGDYAGALSLYRDLFLADPQARWGLPQAAALQALDAPRDALAALDAVPAGGLADDEREALLRARTRSLLALQDWPALAAALQARRDLSPDNADLAQVAAALADEAARADVAAALVLSDPAEAGRRLRALSASRPDSAPLRYLAATRGLPLPEDPWKLSFSPDERREIAEALPLLAAAPGACDVLAEDLLALAEHAIDLQEYPLGRAVADAVTSGCRDAVPRYEADLLLERIAWEEAGR